MATPATMNAWLDELSASIIENHQYNKSKPNTARKLQDSFRRRVRRHNYGRTNQFEVVNRLDGLEEKFQILNLDNLSDALRKRRIELKPFENHWLPDILDLFLHLSGNPATNQTLLELYRIPPRIGTPPPLKWKDLLADSPIDRNDKLWKVPDYRAADDSGYDDDFTSSIGSATISPRQTRKGFRTETNFEVSKVLYDPASNTRNEIEVSINYQETEVQDLSELQFIRQSLFMLRGCNTKCFLRSRKQLILNPQVKVTGISQTAFTYAANEFLFIRKCLDEVVTWLAVAAGEPYIAAMQHAVESVVQGYYRSVDGFQQIIINPENTSIVSLSSTLSKINLVSVTVKTVSQLLNKIKQGDSITHLDTLYEAVQDSQLCADTQRYACLVSLLKPALDLYLKPVSEWMERGSTTQDTLPPFIEMADTSLDLRNIWNGQFRIASTNHKRAPKFLADTTDQVLATGKTSAFLRQLRVTLTIPSTNMTPGDRFELPSTECILLPFAQAFERAWQQFVEDSLHCQTLKLKLMLSTHCDFAQKLHSIQNLYLPRSGLLMHDVEVSIFDKIDRCMDGWNDRFQVKDMLEDAFLESGDSSTIDSINVRSAYTSSRIMHHQRTSVKILSSLSFEYVLSWPLANIISDASMTSYRRAALVLMQIRRARYCLERTGYIAAASVPLGPDTTPADQTFAQTLAFTLLTFVNTLFDAMMLSSIWPATDAMEAHLQRASTVDEMVEIHRNYITRLECSCLAAPRLKLLRQSLLSILDLCIRFSDLVSNPTKTDHDGSDHEVSSFISAKSRNRSLRKEQYDSDEEDDGYAHGLGDGYSSFIVLGNDTSIVNELKKVKSQFEKQAKFLISGLRGVSKGGHDTSDLDALANRLSWLNTR